MERVRLLLVTLAVSGLTWWLFAPATELGFVSWDDPDYVTANEHVLTGLGEGNLAWAFRTDGAAGNWHPLTWLSHMFDAERYGKDPAGHHRTSVLLHAANAGLAFLALALCTRAWLASLLVALLFAVHPLRVESVAWVSERKDVLSGFFALLTIALYAGWARRGGALRHAALVASLVLGLLAKPMLVTLPCVLLLLDVWPLGRWGGLAPESSAVPPGRRRGPRALVLEKLPLFALVALSVGLTLHAQGAGGSIRTTDELSLGARLLHVPIAYLRYLQLDFAPVGLAAFYPHPAVVEPGSLSLGNPRVLGSAALLVVVTAAAWLARRRAPAALVGWLWFVGMLVPVIGLVQVGGQSIADRYTYLPSLGLAVALVFPLFALTRSRPAARVGLLAAGLAACLFLARATRAQIPVWRDSESLFAHALAVTDDNYKAHNSYGVALEERGRVDEARAEYEAALAIRPTHAQALTNLGKLCFQAGDRARAEELFRAALESDPNLVPALGNLGAVLLTKGDLQGGVELLERALALKEDHALHHKNLGLALGMLGRQEESRRHLERAAELQQRAVGR